MCNILPALTFSTKLDSPSSLTFVVSHHSDIFACEPLLKLLNMAEPSSVQVDLDKLSDVPAQGLRWRCGAQDCSPAGGRATVPASRTAQANLSPQDPDLLQRWPQKCVFCPCTLGISRELLGGQDLGPRG